MFIYCSKPSQITDDNLVPLVNLYMIKLTKSKDKFEAVRFIDNTVNLGLVIDL